MPINTKSDYIEFGTSINNDYSLNNVLILPAPHQLPFTSEFIADANRSANGTMMLQQIGRTQYKSKIKWEFLPNKKWWRLNRWLESCGYVFYIKYFNHSDGRVKIHRFYRGNIENAEPSTETEMINGYRVPKRYHNCGFSVIDMGEYNQIVIAEMGIL